ncbi:hypothetical protein F2Q69_00032232 [Brassica cretica]|uniref:Uncharacterized protein n=1 Tax=Brassica cretica TaxID=69181 RepID=A0A8S9S5Q2_BRACR|nr:hypothetical protein F2Q69_00032232 [Brassica cretica]
MSSSFNFPRPTTKADDLENLYKAYRVDRAVVLDLAGTNESPETVRDGYYGAYTGGPGGAWVIAYPAPPEFSGILSPSWLRLGRWVLLLVLAREVGLAFGLSEFRQLVLVKLNKHNPGTFLVSPRPGRHVIEDIPYRDEKWREKFFVFKMYRASMGDFDFSQIPRRWAENIVPYGSSSMSDEIRDLMRALRRGRSNWSTFDRTRIQTVLALPAGTNRAPSAKGSEGETDHSQEVVANPYVQTQSSDRQTRQLVRRFSFRTSGFASRGRASGKSPLISIHDSDDEDVSGETRPPVSLSPGSEDETVAANRK